ncbi:Hypothetical protein LUCI_0168 [Lucifera butyrica]|uniref:Uncharacterized protein n=1 Tax=Lucifera butyrica TaxID=1351585 RepID=A0A498R3W3_9FIRM|nr:hypothetical protein [Lucifera butyrica]VBB04962.1 Hypothetical protein LUCI_0168 [Lucifera butyrica]
MTISIEEKKVLRDLAKQVNEISQNPVWDEKRTLWKQKNSLRKVRPLILCTLPEEAWMEIIPESQLQVKEPLLKTYEWELRKRIYRWEKIKDDEIINNTVYVPVQRNLTDWMEGHVRPHSASANQAAKFTPCINEWSDFKKMKFPQMEVDWKTTDQNFDRVLDVFGDTLHVIKGEPFYAATDREVMGWGNSLIDVLCELRGLENIFYDFVNEPEFIHEAMEFLKQGTMKYLDDLEKNNLLMLNNNDFLFNSNSPCGSNGLGCTDELPQAGFNPDHVTTGHLWGYFMAQELTNVSPAMVEEFILPYQREVAQKFGLNCYGCCEKLDKKYDIILKHIPNLREVAVSLVSDLQIAAEKLKDKYVYSWRPHPTSMISLYDENYIRGEIARAFEITKDCHVIVCLRDTQTLHGEPYRASRWTEIAMELAKNF